MASIAIIGGGIIGSAAAVWLIADGHRVTVFERAPEGRPASTGNAGLIALPEISPLARPGILTSVPGWLLDPLGPLTIRFRDLPYLAPYLARFVAAARPSVVRSATAALATLSKTALADHQELARRGGLSGHLRRTGAFHVFDTDAAFQSAQAEWAERGRHGVESREVAADEVRRVVPALSGAFARALFAPDYWAVSSPNAILQALRRRIAEAGTITAKQVVSFRSDPGTVAVITGEGGDLPFDRVVVAGGVWSRELLQTVGISVPLVAERGYNTTYPNSRIDLPVPVFFAEHGFVATPLADGLRVGGAVELASPDAPPNFARAAAMRKKMRRFVPDLPEAGGIEWMGSRPSTPDSLPVIGADPRDPRIVYAFGHGHHGLTQSAVTARLIAGLLAGRPDPALKPFAVERFGRARGGRS
ncbi:MAG: FAD-binding oxidoreductase [Bauldia sp.]|nr:MAG: FAD-binding oxidoreductase [Bauldia sp.]